MDTFDALLNEASQKAQEDGVPYAAALTSVLSGQQEIAEGESAGAYRRDAAAQEQIVTPEALAAALALVAPVRINAVLPQADWTESGDEAYPYACRFEAPLFTPNRCTDMVLTKECADAASKARLCAVTDTGQGYVCITAKSVPTEDLAVTFITKLTIANTYAESREIQ